MFGKKKKNAKPRGGAAKKAAAERAALYTVGSHMAGGGKRFDITNDQKIAAYNLLMNDRNRE